MSPIHIGHPVFLQFLGIPLFSYLSAFLFREDLVGVVIADDLDEPRVEVLADSNL